jgi:hypothetical protein
LVIAAKWPTALDTQLGRERVVGDINYLKDRQKPISCFILFFLREKKIDGKE